MSNRGELEERAHGTDSGRGGDMRSAARAVGTGSLKNVPVEEVTGARGGMVGALGYILVVEEIVVESSVEDTAISPGFFACIGAPIDALVHERIRG